MRLSVIWLFAIIFAQYSFAQKHVVGEIQKINLDKDLFDMDSDIKYVWTGEAGPNLIYNVHAFLYTEQVVISLMDHHCTTQQADKFTLEFEGNKVEVFDVIDTKAGTFILAYYSVSKKSEENEIVRFKINFETLEISQGIAISKVENFRPKLSIATQLDFSYWGYQFSPDSTKLLFVYTYKRTTGTAFNLKSKYSTELTLCDANFNLLKSYRPHDDFSNEDYIPSNFTINNEGDIYFSIKEKVTKKQANSPAEAKIGYIYKYGSYAFVSDKVTVGEFGVSDEYALLSTNSQITEDNTVIFRGLLTNASDKKLSSLGLYLLEIDEKSDNKHQFIYKYNIEDFINEENMSSPKRYWREYIDELKADIQFTELVKVNDGYICQFDFSADVVTSTPNAPSQFKEGPTVLFKLNTNGNLDWNSVIEKEVFWNLGHYTSPYLWISPNDNNIHFFSHNVLLARQSSTVRTHDMLSQIIDIKTGKFLVRDKVILPEKDFNKSLFPTTQYLTEIGLGKIFLLAYDKTEYRYQPTLISY